MNHRFAQLMVTFITSSFLVPFVEASVSTARRLGNLDENRTSDVFHKRRRPHSKIYNAVENSTEIKSNNSFECKSIIAIGKTTIWNDHDTGEEFVCERQDGSDVPIEGTEEQIQELRDLLNNGTLISAESTIEVYQANVAQAAIDSGQVYSPSPVVLPPGNVILRPSELRTRERLAYEGQKPVLVVKVIDITGLAVGDDATTISDKIFGTNGDSTTMTSQFAACSFKKLQISWKQSSSIQKVLSAPGVLEVNIGISIIDSEQYAIRGAVYAAAGEKLGFALPGPFHHVMFVLEGCYKECGWAAYAYVNSWMSVYQGEFYKHPGVQMHEIGHNLNLAHSGGIDGEIYTDHTCLMGNPLYSDDIVKMCYNPAKNFQIAKTGSWFSKDLAISFDSTKRGNWAGRIIGAAEYNVNPMKHPFVVKIITGSSRDLFVGFNRAVGPNAENQQASDLVSIIEAGDGYDYAQSYLRVLLASGQEQAFPNWRGSSHILTVTVNEINTSARPGYADITITFGSQSHRRPTSNPTTQSYSPTLNLPTYTSTLSPAYAGDSELYTSNTNSLDKSVKGIMFTVKAKQDITIRAFEIVPRKYTNSVVTVYTKHGDYQLNPRRNEWTVVYHDALQLEKPTTTLEVLNVNIAAGQKQSFFVYVDAGMRIKTTANAGQTHGQDEAIILYSGTAYKREFYSTLGYGQYAGAIKYGIP